MLVLADWTHSKDVFLRWAPDGEALLAFTRPHAVAGNRCAMRFDNALPIVSIKSGTCWGPRLPFGATLSTIAWSPDSRLVLALGVTDASFMDSLTCTVSSQQMSSLQPRESPCASADWSSARLVCLSYYAGYLLVCSAGGNPPQLQALHTVPTGGVGLWPSCSPGGLLCSWIEFDAGFDFDFSMSRTMFSIGSDDAGSVAVCELLTGRKVHAARLQSVAYDCYPQELFSCGPTGGEDRCWAKWAPDGLSMFLCDAAPGCLSRPVRQLTF